MSLPGFGLTWLEMVGLLYPLCPMHVLQYYVRRFGVDGMEVQLSASDLLRLVGYSP